jgi:hypothetical protein
MFFSFPEEKTGVSFERIDFQWLPDSEYREQFHSKSQGLGSSQNSFL